MNSSDLFTDHFFGPLNGFIAVLDFYVLVFGPPRSTPVNYVAVRSSLMADVSNCFTRFAHYQANLVNG